MDELRDDNGYIRLDESMLVKIFSLKLFLFKYKDKNYYVKNRENPLCYNELIAEELAKDYGIKCVHYDIAIYNNKTTVISEDFVKDNKYIPMYSLIDSNFKNNTLEKIWNTLETMKFNKRHLTKNEVELLMNKIVDIFIFDILIANVDRNPYNYGLLVNGNTIDVAPIFDNEALLHDDALKDSNFLMNVDNEISGNVIEYFLNISYSEYFEKFKRKLNIISNENLLSVFNRVEQRTKSKINKGYKQILLEKFEMNKNKLEEIINEVENRKNIK